MGHLFLDIETYVDQHDEDSALNPYHTKSKVILIAYNYYSGFKPPVKSEIKPPIFLKEWELGEGPMLKQFFELLKELQHKDQHLKIHGFNVLKFDLPYLFGRMKAHNTASEEDVYNMLFRPFGTDMMQLASLVSNEIRTKEQLWGMSQKAVNSFFGIQVKEGSGKDCSRHYDNGDFGKILEYCTQEFTFEQLLNSFYLYAHRLQEGRE